MINIFIAIIFMAELIIATALVLNIYRLNLRIIELNNSISTFKSTIKSDCRYFRYLLKVINSKIYKLSMLVKRKQEEYFFNMLKTTLIYTSLLALKGKYRKIVLGYQIGREIFEGIQEA